MVQAESQIKGRIAVPRALGVEEYRTVARDENVFRTDVAMHQAVLGSGGALRQPLQRGCEIGMPGGRGDEVGLEADGVEDGIGGEGRRDVGFAGGCGVDRGKAGANLGSERRIGAAFAQQRFPYWMVQVLHGEKPRGVVPPEHARRGAGCGTTRGLHPLTLVAVALDRRLPHLRHAQARQRALHADRHAGQFDAPDVGGHPAGERLHADRRAEAGAMQKLGDEGVAHTGRRRPRL